MSLMAVDFTKEITLEGETITIQKLSLGDQSEIAKKARIDEIEASKLMLVISIKRWSLKNPDGNAMPISMDNVLKIKMESVNDIMKEIYNFNNLKATDIKNL